VDSTSWVHDQPLRLTDFMSGLTMKFTDAITSPASNRHGWCLVTVEYRTGSPGTTLPTPAGTMLVHRVDGQITVTGSTVKFTPHPDFRTTFLNTTGGVAELAVLGRIVVKCDFLLDSQARPVDGNHLKGTLSSGDQVAGGEFESWFRLTPN
jgi:hypothetical protein